MNVVFYPRQRESAVEIYYIHKPLHKTERPNTTPEEEQGNSTENQMYPKVDMISQPDTANKSQDPSSIWSPDKQPIIFRISLQLEVFGTYFL